MIYLDIVMTAKAAQGRGYGSALIKLVLEEVRRYSSFLLRFCILGLMR